MTAEQFLQQRFNDLNSGDFKAIYSSYHPDAPFLTSFPDCGAYVEFAKKQLGAIKVQNWQSKRQRTVASDQEEHLLLMELVVDGGSQYFYELARLIETTDGWRYHSAQKLNPEDYSGAPDLIDFCHFDQVTQKIIF